MDSHVIGEWLHNAAESKNLSMCGNFKRENREILLVSSRQRHVDCSGGTVRKRRRRYR